jgi:hypothetical protein
VSAVCQLAGDKASELGVTKIEHEVVLARFGPGHILALSACIVYRYTGACQLAGTIGGLKIAVKKSKLFLENTSS